MGGPVGGKVNKPVVSDQLPVIRAASVSDDGPCRDGRPRPSGRAQLDRLVNNLCPHRVSLRAPPALNWHERSSYPRSRLIVRVAAYSNPGCNCTARLATRYTRDVRQRTVNPPLR